MVVGGMWCGRGAGGPLIPLPLYPLGTHIKCFRFWNQFESEINISELSTVSKISYLEELLTCKARVIIDGLPFSSDAYTIAKNILISNYGNSSEIANTDIQNIMSLTHINKINFYKDT